MCRKLYVFDSYAEAREFMAREANSPGFQCTKVYACDECVGKYHMTSHPRRVSVVKSLSKPKTWIVTGPHGQFSTHRKQSVAMNQAITYAKTLERERKLMEVYRIELESIIRKADVKKLSRMLTAARKEK